MQPNFLCVELLCALKRKTGKVLGMCSFEEARKMLVLISDMEVINDKALLCCWMRAPRETLNLSTKTIRDSMY